jgi:hypothetical protein
MTNLKTIRAFVNKEEGHSLHIISENNKLFSYATCIAQWYDDKIIINCTKYSLTSSKHKTMLLTEIPRYIELIELNDIPKDEDDLEKYIFKII